MMINKIYLTILVILASSITYGVTTALATLATFSPGPDAGSGSENTVVGDNDTFRQFLTCMLDADGDEGISEEEITSALEAGSDEPVIVEEGEIKDCFEPLYVTGTGTTSTPSPSIPSPSPSVDTTDAAGDSGETDDDEGDDDEGDDDEGDDDEE
jgi:hypothetical protein